MKKIEIEIPDGKKAEWVNGVLTLVDYDSSDVRERVRTFEDACRELGRRHPLVCQYYAIDDVDANLNAYLKLRIICAALNEGWDPYIEKGERSSLPYFRFFGKEDEANMSEEERRAWHLKPTTGYRTFFEFLGTKGSYSFSTERSNFGICLYLKNGILAEYCGAQFIDSWMDFMLKRN